MKAISEKSRDELLKESRLLYQKLNTEMKLIGKEKETPLLKDAYNRFQQLKKDIRYNDLSKYSDDMVKNIYRDLNYISSLKSSTKEGAIEANKLFGHTDRFLNSLSKEKQKQFWDLYDKVYATLLPTMVERYRYEVFDVITNEMYLGQNIDDIFEKIVNMFNEAYQAGESEGDKGELFREKLILQSSESWGEFFDQFI